MLLFVSISRFWQSKTARECLSASYKKNYVVCNVLRLLDCLDAEIEFFDDTLCDFDWRWLSRKWHVTRSYHDDKNERHSLTCMFRFRENYQARYRFEINCWITLQLESTMLRDQRESSQFDLFSIVSNCLRRTRSSRLTNWNFFNFANRKHMYRYAQTSHFICQTAVCNNDQTRFWSIQKIS